MAELEQRTGVNRETIRVFLRLGLLPQPERPKPTIAHYTEDHVRGIQAIRQLQQTYRMTLDQIGRVLQGRPIEGRVEATAFQHLEQLLVAATGVPDKLVALSTLSAANPHAASDARALEGLGIVERVRTGDGPALSHTDARLIAIWQEMRGLGFNEETNFYPDSLDHYFRAAEYLARAEAEKFIARTEGRIPEEDAARMLAAALPLMMDFFGLLRTKFFLRNMREHAKATGEKAAPAIGADPAPYARKSRPKAAKGKPAGTSAKAGDPGAKDRTPSDAPLELDDVRVGPNR